METEKLGIVKISELHSGDGWSYIIKVYYDVTEIFYKEHNEEPVALGQLTAGFDLQVCEEIIKLRKEKMAEEE